MAATTTILSVLLILVISANAGGTEDTSRSLEIETVVEAADSSMTARELTQSGLRFTFSLRTDVSDRTKCVETYNGTPGKHYYQFLCRKVERQVLRIRQAKSAVLGSNKYNIVTYNGLCWAVAGHSTNDRAAIEAWPCNDKPDQEFNFILEDRNVYTPRVSITTFNGKCVDVAQGSDQDWARIQQYRCNGTPAQFFQMALPNTQAL